MTLSCCTEDAATPCSGAQNLSLGRLVGSILKRAEARRHPMLIHHPHLKTGLQSYEAHCLRTAFELRDSDRGCFADDEPFDQPFPVGTVLKTGSEDHRLRATC